MSTRDAAWYDRLVEHFLRESGLAEGRRAAPPEKRLQLLWRHQRVVREGLRTLDGRTVVILHPGFWNREPGPDFLRAFLQIGDEPARSGDVELDPEPRDWQSHRHGGNPRYRHVLLRVIWDTPARDPGPDGPPLLALKPHLDAPWEELESWLAARHPDDVPDPVRGRCEGPLRSLSPGQAAGVLAAAGRRRWRNKAESFARRSRQVGPEQSLREGLFAALGYKHNVWPMRRLAELAAREGRFSGHEHSVLVWQARLFGLAGLLPSQPPRTAANYVRRLWDAWWREQAQRQPDRLPPEIWNFAGVRPANHPHRRLALAAHWLAADLKPAALGEWIAHPDEPPGPDSLLRRLQPREEDPFWERHWTLRSAAFDRPQPLLGSSRVTDLAMNTVLPWLWAGATASGDETGRRRVEECLETWPAGQDNAVLRLARQRLFAGTPPPLPRQALLQQGLLQVVRDFCSQTNALCADCRFPDLVRAVD